ncbi:MAG: RHS repeat-associated core domain-containing protein, partial [Myxococcota bacterium]
GNITQINDLADARTNKPDFAADYSYDAWYRVTEASLSNSETITLGFDLIDNITAATSTVADSPANVGNFGYTSFAPNALTEAGGVSYGYDMAGHMNARGEQSMTWDFMGRMTSVSEGGEMAAQMTYGFNQSRVIKREGDRQVLYINEDFEVRDGIATLYIKVDHKRVARIEETSLATTLFTDGNTNNQIDAADAWLARNADEGPGGHLWSSVRRLLVETGPTDGVTYLHHDHLESITLATSQEGDATVIEGERSFYPLGQVREEMGYVDTYGFTGQEHDQSTGLVHFDYRYYDPRVGRWLSIDPLFAAATPDNITTNGEVTTAYNYVAGNILNNIDPTGLKIDPFRRVFGRLFGTSDTFSMTFERERSMTIVEPNTTQDNRNDIDTVLGRLQDVGLLSNNVSDQTLDLNGTDDLITDEDLGLDELGPQLSDITVSLSDISREINDDRDDDLDPNRDTYDLDELRNLARKGRETELRQQGKENNDLKTDVGNQTSNSDRSERLE